MSDDTSEKLKAALKAQLKYGIIVCALISAIVAICITTRGYEVIPAAWLTLTCAIIIGIAMSVAFLFFE